MIWSREFSKILNIATDVFRKFFYFFVVIILMNLRTVSECVVIKSISSDLCLRLCQGDNSSHASLSEAIDFVSNIFAKMCIHVTLLPAAVQNNECAVCVWVVFAARAAE